MRTPMAKVEDESMTREDPGQDALAAFFAAARAEEAGPSSALLERILADAGAVAAERAPAAVPAWQAPRPAPSLAERLRRAFAPFGGLTAAAALGGFAAAGFIAGLAGGADAWQPSTATFDGPAEAIVAFYDLAAPEG